MRLDLYLKDKYQWSRQQAQDQIAAGYVKVNQKVITKPSFAIQEFDQVEVSENDTLKFVSRAGLKLEAALERTKISVKGMYALDLGQSTGGFSDCLLQYGAKQIWGFDVGHDQLHKSLQDKVELHSFEGVNIKSLTKESLLQYTNGASIDLLVADLSFISSVKLLPHIATLIDSTTICLILIKPQFEVGAENINKKGLVKDDSLYQVLAEDCKKISQQAGFLVLDYFESELPGKDGNKEYFLYAKKDHNTD